ncbi:MAG: zinc ribbon domain-containing protein [Pseudomonadota bacterium]
MPIFEYVCLDCGKVFETLVLNSREEVCCPDCESKRLEKAMSSFALSAGSSGSRGASLGGCSSKGGFS